MIKYFFISTVSLLLCFFASPLLAINLGVYGQIYPIQEQDLLEFIQQKLLRWQDSGKLSALQQQFVLYAQQHIDRPTPVENISAAKINKTWLFDPSLHTSTDIKDPSGHVLAEKGQIINPLDWVTLREMLVFYDGDSTAQVEWAQKIQSIKKIKLILVKGSIAHQSAAFKQAIYFDQQGRLTQRFGIQHVPALITQEGKFLKITEVKL